MYYTIRPYTSTLIFLVIKADCIQNISFGITAQDTILLMTLAFKDLT